MEIMVQVRAVEFDFIFILEYRKVKVFLSGIINIGIILASE